jgi:hypothetical protein
MALALTCFALGVALSTLTSPSVWTGERWRHHALAKDADYSGTDSAGFRQERQTLYAEITQAVFAKTSTGNVDLQSGDLVLVTARSSQFARVKTDDGEATIPISATDLTAISTH